ncbi:MAG TPA: helix-turn-helix domain-containing protein [Fibrobacteria bacterium]|nr:helix-turn-helix domain-containing protein [Fibrobacteria bacterium]
MAIRKRRTLLGITQRDLSEVAGVSLRSLKALEAGDANPSLGQMIKVFDALGWKMALEERGK